MMVDFESSSLLAIRVSPAAHNKSTLQLASCAALRGSFTNPIVQIADAQTPLLTDSITSCLDTSK